MPTVELTSCPICNGTCQTPAQSLKCQECKGVGYFTEHCNTCGGSGTTFSWGGSWDYYSVGSDYCQHSEPCCNCPTERFPCRSCNGTGNISYEPSACPFCAGTGKVTLSVADYYKSTREQLAVAQRNLAQTQHDLTLARRLALRSCIRCGHRLTFADRFRGRDTHKRGCPTGIQASLASSHCVR